MAEDRKFDIEAMKAARRAWLEDQVKRRTWGERGPIPSIQFVGKRVVAVYNQLLTLPEEATYHDFLGVYIKRALGEEWWVAEAAKAQGDWHQLIQWQRKVYEFQVKHQLGQGVQSAPGKGVVGHYYRLAFDLHTIEHQGLLQSQLIKRLKIPTEFQGARYEVIVSAAFVRAGFDVVFEAEGKGPDKLCDFLVTHRASGKSYAVEAKSRHIAGVLGRPANGNPSQKAEPNVRGLITDALQKVAAHPRIICVDVNYPQPHGANPTTTWLPVVRDQVNKLEADGCDAAILLLTNSPLHYLRDDENARDDAAAVMGLSDPNFRPDDRKSVDEGYPGLIRAAAAFAAPIPQNWP